MNPARPTRRRNGRWLICALWPLGLLAQTNAPLSPEFASELAARAESLTQTGARSEAIALVAGQLARPGWPVPAEARLCFTLGWLYREEARQQRDQSRPLLERSAAQYRRVLARYPGHVQASENLVPVLRELGRPGEALAVLEQVSATNQTPAQAYTHWLTTGDVLAELNEPEKAANAYERAFRLDPKDERAPARVVALYSALPSRWNDRLFALCAAFDKAGQTQSARRGYEVLIRQETRGGSATPLAQKTIEAWVEAESRQGTLSAASLERLPAGLVQQTQALAELALCVNGPCPKPDALKFWRDSSLRKHVIASVCRGLAQQHRLAGQFQEAAAYYDLAIALAPEFGYYSSDLKGHPFIGLDAALDLATLYRAQPSLDPKGEKFARLENELLDGKNMAYVESNLPAMEKYHVVLGLVYAERGRWAGWDWRTAPYHLDRAVRTAQQIAGRDAAEYQPLPHLTRLLAEGLATNAQPNLDLARKYSLQSAQGFLDQDDLKNAEQMIRATEVYSTRLGKPEPAGTDGLKLLLNNRKTIDTLEPAALRVAVPEKYLVTKPVNALDPRFVQRQEVRACQDLATHAYEAGAIEGAERLQQHALWKLQSAPGATREDLNRALASPVLTPAQKRGGAAARQPGPAATDSLGLVKAEDLKGLKLPTKAP